MLTGWANSEFGSNELARPAVAAPHASKEQQMAPAPYLATRAETPTAFSSLETGLQSP